jgi:hypothetical protein
MRILHNRPLHTRIAAATSGSLSLVMLAVFNPINIRPETTLGAWFLWIATLFFVGYFGFAIYLWRIAPAVASPTLPDPANWGGPNSISSQQRLFNALAAVFLLAYSSFGMYEGQIYVPGKYGNGRNVTGASAWCLYAAMLCAATYLVLQIIDHYDRRNNERVYADLGEAVAIVGVLSWLFSFLLR